MNTNDKERFNSGTIAFQERAIASGIWQTCLNCFEWDKKGKICKRFKATPPIEVLVNGCKFYNWEIPF